MKERIAKGQRLTAVKQGAAMTPLCCLKCGSAMSPADEGKFFSTMKPLIGDAFFTYECSLCVPSGAVFSRVPLSWYTTFPLTQRPLRIQIIQLVLYHLHKTDRHGVGFYRWKEDICRLIEDHWDSLCPNKSRTASWMNSVSSVLSANDLLFESGFEKLKQPGFWALKVVQPPQMLSTSGGNKKRKTIKPDDEIIDVGNERSMASQSYQNRSYSLDQNQATLFARRYADRIPTVQTLLPAEKEATPTTVKAAEEIKRKLVERLLRVDSRLLQEALATAPPPGPAPPSPTNMTIPILAPLLPPEVASTGASSVIAASESSAAVDPALLARSRSVTPMAPPEIVTKDMSAKKPIRFIKPPNYVRASPHENEILDSCLRIANPDATVARLKRKLLLRRAKRRVGLPLFDIDAFMYKYLKSTEALRLQEPDSLSEEEVVDVEGITPNEPKTFFDVPFHRDPTLSFLAKLVGNSNVLTPFPNEIISPYTGVRLPAIIYKEITCQPKKLSLLREINKKFSTEHIDDPICFVHVRKEWLPQVNRLLRTFFWPSVDMIESLDYPDYGVLVMYRKLVIGCAFVTPDGYLQYFFIHPDWQGAGLGKKLLYLVITRCSPQNRDLTLHVSVTNPAMLLYQQFGFKPEEFIVNFYDKYLRQNENSLSDLDLYSKNAFLIRYRR